DHLVDRTVAASRNDFSKSVPDSSPGQCLCLAGLRRGVNETTASDRFKPLPPGPPAQCPSLAGLRRGVNEKTAIDRFNALLPVFRLLITCGRVENDDCITHTKGGWALLSFIH